MSRQHHGELIKKRRRQAERNAAKRLLHEAGWTDTAIGRVLGVTRKAITGWRLRNDLPAHANPFSNRIDEARAVELHEQGLSDGMIARELSVTQSGVTRWRHRRDLPANHEQHRRIDPRTRRSMLNMLAEGASRRQVSEEFGCGSQNTMARMRAKVGGNYLRSVGITNQAIRRRILKDRRIRDRIVRAVGTHLPRDVLHDAATSLYVDVLEGRLDARLIEARASRYRNRAYSLNGFDFATRSLDGDEGSSFRPLDALDDPSSLCEMEEAAERAYDHHSERWR